MTASRARRIAAVFASGSAVAALAAMAGALALFVGNDQSPRVFAQVAAHFTIAAVVLAVLLALANALGAWRRWWSAALSGLVASVIAGSIATVYSLVAIGRPLSPPAALFVLGSIVSFNLIFEIAAVLGEVFVAPAVMRRILHARRRHGRRLALVRVPPTNLDDGLRTHLDRVPVDAELADEQWDHYCAALVAEGWHTVEVGPAPDLADSVFVEDAVVVFGDLAVVTRPGAESRRAEVEAVEKALRDIRGLKLAHIIEPGTLDGGDVLTVGSTVYVGASSRTNADGIRQLRAMLSPRGFAVVAVPIRKTLHLKSAVTALPDGTIIGDADALESTSVFPRFVAVPEPTGAAVVELAPHSLLMAASAPRTAEMLAGFGYRVVTVDISEFEKLEGCVTCLSVRIP